MIRIFHDYVLPLDLGSIPFFVSVGSVKEQDGVPCRCKTGQWAILSDDCELISV